LCNDFHSNNCMDNGKKQKRKLVFLGFHFPSFQYKFMRGF
jgi:hypothetical protein